jgi:hypothetical protein
VAAGVKAEKDWRVRLWLRIKLGGESLTAVARELGYSDSSGVHRVVARLDEKAKSDAPLRNRLETVKKAIMSNVRR